MLLGSLSEVLKYRVCWAGTGQSQEWWERGRGECVRYALRWRGLRLAGRFRGGGGLTVRRPNEIVPTNLEIATAVRDILDYWKGGKMVGRWWNGRMVRRDGEI